ncbi:MAG: hypothetical protein ACRDVZ_02675, partial [Jiangellaceae bacterium]
MRPATLVLITVGLMASACSASPSPAPDASEQPTSAPAQPPVAPTSEPMSVPVALAVHPNRLIADVPVAAARALMAGNVDSWSELGQPAGEITITASGVG